MWVKNRPPGDHRFWSLLPLTRVPFWGYPIFDPQPHRGAPGRTARGGSPRGPDSAPTRRPKRRWRPWTPAAAAAARSASPGPCPPGSGLPPDLLQLGDVNNCYFILDNIKHRLGHVKKKSEIHGMQTNANHTRDKITEVWRSETGNRQSFFGLPKTRDWPVCLTQNIFPRGKMGRRSFV